ncbi:MAG TPA: Asp-tRNA(Asn)/Glu-tRNA(Gln) amidotransferase GatCAB subunit B [Peptococcaceae bacterium]|nr:Asp-tRNA(Asn)/Glu-tRNA(Gln) amidotransferase GatCAB subunit B [Peptococcaceae bacterium]
MTAYEIVVGMECHVELKTKTKLFCSCAAEFSDDPNRHICPVCLGMPGALPVVNRQAIEYAVKAALALHCQVQLTSRFDRKNYHYPDLPTAYQITQMFYPIAKGGYVDIETSKGSRRIRLNRIHVEADAGKLLHGSNGIGGAGDSLADDNRGSTPLIEIVSEPDIRSAEEARVYGEKLRTILEYAGVSDVKMEQGSMRCDANVSVRPKGDPVLGTRAEVKNVNSFKAVERAVHYEAERQIDLIEEGGVVVQETRGWDDEKGISISMRLKENAHDYRYFPEPDLPPIILDPEHIRAIGLTLPEMPEARKVRMVSELKLSEYDSEQITASRYTADLFDETVALGAEPKAVANWIMGELLRCARTKGVDLAAIPVKAQNLAALLAHVAEGKINNKQAKEVFEEMFDSGEAPEAIIRKKGMTQVSDAGALEEIVQTVLAGNPKSVEDYKNGRTQAMGFLVGQVMKASKGQANPGVVNQLLTAALEAMK